ncbi:hypothetical protein QBC46DRAFT_396622 [Diplogelasinospora grovesii]|uniref:Apple domain-containing protein n=1 Tax=Diplogelasinospora grovesii TaxID=303347 RepID=A0AAN6RZN0_9PEZI|nr:hypothetical protein QBC46DRAFT_396622 [Diplogelasinospora grovesii]
MTNEAKVIRNLERMMERRQRGGDRNTPRDSLPCPRGNGTEIGTSQQFTLVCNSNINGKPIDAPVDASDFTACVDLCSAHHPRCDAVTFDGKNCQLMDNLRDDPTRPARRFDAAVGIFQTATSNCPTLGGAQAAQGINFSLTCGSIINGYDMTQNFAPTLQDCMGQCANTTNCAALSFDPSQAQGFKNCYLKTAVANSSDILADQGIDSAQVANNAVAASSSAAAAAPVPVPTTVSAAPVAPAPAPATTDAGATAIPPASTSNSGGIVFFTPPGVSTAVASAEAPASSTDSALSEAATSVLSSSTASATDLLTTATTSASANPLPPYLPKPSSSTSSVFGLFPTTTGSIASATDITATPDASTQGDSGGTSQAWIAAPVVGSVAALVLIVLSFMMLKRRRRNDMSTGRSARNISRPSPVSALFTTWLPGSPKWAPSSRNSNKGMGNFSEIESAPRRQPSTRNSVRASSVLGIIRPSAANAGMERLGDIEEGGGVREKGAVEDEKGEGTPVYGVKNGKMELRNSFNGLGQNRWS